MDRLRFAHEAVRTVAILVLLGGIAAVIAQAPDAVGPAHAAARSVEMGDNFFSPASMTVTVGDTITWPNNGNLPHTTTSGIRGAQVPGWDHTVFTGASSPAVSFLQPLSTTTPTRTPTPTVTPTATVTPTMTPTPTATLTPTPNRTPTPSPMRTATVTPSTGVPIEVAAPTPSPIPPDTGGQAVPTPLLPALVALGIILLLAGLRSIRKRQVTRSPIRSE